MSRIEQLKKKFASVHEEAARQEAARKQAQQEAAEEAAEKERCELEAKLAERKLADENWPLVKEKTVAFLHELNREMLNSRGKVFERVGRISDHEHVEVEGMGGRDGRYLYFYLFRGRTDAVELKIDNIGSLVVFRPVKVESCHVGSGNSPAERIIVRGFKNDVTDSYDGIYVKFFLESFLERKRQEKRNFFEREIAKKRDFFCPLCFGRATLSLACPLEEITCKLKDQISEKFIALQEAALLE